MFRLASPQKNKNKEKLIHKDMRTVQNELQLKTSARRFASSISRVSLFYAMQVTHTTDAVDQ